MCIGGPFSRVCPRDIPTGTLRRVSLGRNKRMSVELAVVMPAYNEGNRIYENLLTCAATLEKFCPSFRIIAVNDGSTDNTETEMRRAAAENAKIGIISYEKNRGKGYAIRRGMMASKARYTAFLDADLDLPPEQLEGYLSAMKERGTDIVLGSKLHPDSNLEYPFYRKAMTMGYYLYLKLLFHLPIRDTQTGIKLFSTEAIRPVVSAMRSDRFCFDIELLALAKKNGLSMEERPVVVRYHGDGERKTKIRLRTIFDMFFETFRIWRRIKK